MEEAVVLTDDGDEVMSEKTAEEAKTEKKKKRRTKIKAKKLILNVSMTEPQFFSRSMALNKAQRSRAAVREKN